VGLVGFGGGRGGGGECIVATGWVFCREEGGKGVLGRGGGCCGFMFTISWVVKEERKCLYGGKKENPLGRAIQGVKSLSGGGGGLFGGEGLVDGNIRLCVCVGGEGGG